MAEFTKSEIDLINLFDENIVSSYNFDELEVELRVGLGLSKFNGDANLLNYSQFKRISNYLEKMSPRETIKNNKSLDIYIYKSETVNPSEITSNLRFTISSMEEISKYCRTGLLPSSNRYSIMYKGNFNWEPATKNLAMFVNSSAAFKKNNFRCNADIGSYRIRCGGKVEIPVKEEDKKPWSKMISDIENNKLTECYEDAKKAYDIADSLIRKQGFDKVFKTYRLKDRTSFIFDYNENLSYRLDLTKIKVSKKIIDEYGNDNSIAVLNFIDSEIVEQEESYEVEIELIHNNKFVKHDIKNFLVEFIPNFYANMMKDAYEIPVYTTLTEEEDVKEIYSQLIRKIIEERLKYKIKVLDEVEDYRRLRESSLQSKEDKELLTNLLDKYTSKYDYFNLVKDSSTSVDIFRSNINAQLNDIQNKSYNDEFIGPNVVSITMDDVRPENPNSIQYDYTVTEKADGLGMLLFKVGLTHIPYNDSLKYQKYKNRIYLIDGNMRVLNTGITCKQEFMQSSIILNGEYLRYGISDKAATKPVINMYGIFDTYIYGDKDTRSLKLISDMDEKTRLSFAHRFLEKNVFETNDTGMEVFVKKFYIANESTSIFEHTGVIWNKYKSGFSNYKLDGTIYTPRDAPVGYKFDNPNYDTNFKNSTWRMNLKWKPKEDNSIDFLIRFEKDTVASYGNRKIENDKVISLLFLEDSIQQSRKFKVGNLFVGGRDVIRPPPCTNQQPRESGPYKPLPFKPKHPFDDEVSYGYFPIKTINNKSIVYDLEDEPVLDNTIVECSYTGFEPGNTDFEKNKNLRWKILRTRHDKTFSYRNNISRQKKIFTKIQRCIQLSKMKQNPTGKQLELFDEAMKYLRDIPQIRNSKSTLTNYEKIKAFANDIEKQITKYEDININKLKIGNNVQIAENIWSSMHNPVTEEIITTGNGIPTIPEEEEKYYSKAVSEQREKSITISLQEFHNKYIKNRLLIENVTTYLRDIGTQEIALLDLACGKGGDIPKWRDNSIDICVGIDKFKNNIYDENDGACERLNYYKSLSQYKGSLPKTYFMVGDLSKLIDDESAFSDINSKLLYKKLWYPDNDTGTNFKDRQFDIISIMFALHYFMRDKTSFNNLLANIDKNLKKGGFLIGACFDGMKLFNMLKDNPYNSSKEINLSGSNILKIIKKYVVEDNQLRDDETSLGLGIDVLIYSINKLEQEFLVNFNYLVKELEKLGIKLLKPDELSKMRLPKTTGKSYGSFEDVFTMLQKNAYTPLEESIVKNLKEEEKKVSFLNNYFIFRKQTESEALTNRIVSIIKMKLQSKLDVINWVLNKNWSELRKLIRNEIGDFDDISWDNALEVIKFEIDNQIIVLDKPKKKIVIKKDMKEKIENIEIEDVKTIKPVDTKKEKERDIESDISSTLSEKSIKILKIKGKKVTVSQRKKFNEIYPEIRKILDEKGYLNPNITGIPQKYINIINKLLDSFSNESYWEDDDIGKKLKELKVLSDRFTK